MTWVDQLNTAVTSINKNILDLWETDKPYIIAVGVGLMAGANALGLQIPTWASLAAYGLGIAAVHQSVKLNK